MNPAWIIVTGRLVLTPVGWADLPELRALKGDPGTFGQMFGGVRSTAQVAEELAQDVMFWASRGVGIWLVRHASGGPAVGLTGMHQRLDGRGTALRFAFRPDARGRGLAREAAGAALRFGHAQGRLDRIVAVAREDNIASRTVLGAIGMRPCAGFMRDGLFLLEFESLASPRPADAWR